MSIKTHIYIYIKNSNNILIIEIIYKIVIIILFINNYTSVLDEQEFQYIFVMKLGPISLTSVYHKPQP